MSLFTRVCVCACVFLCEFVYAGVCVTLEDILNPSSLNAKQKRAKNRARMTHKPQNNMLHRADWETMWTQQHPS